MNVFKLTPHFYLREFECPCCGTVMMDEYFIGMLEKLRVEISLPIKINSGYRCRAYQKALKLARYEITGVMPPLPKIPFHTEGVAADIRIMDRPILNDDIPMLNDIGFTGIGISPSGWAHLDSGHDTIQTWKYSY